MKFCKKIVDTLKIEEDKEGEDPVTFDEDNLILTGSSIIHVNSEIEGITFPFYYAQRNIQSALK